MLVTLTREPSPPLWTSSPAALKSDILWWPSQARASGGEARGRRRPRRAATPRRPKRPRRSFAQPEREWGAFTQRRNTGPLNTFAVQCKPSRAQLQSRAKREWLRPRSRGANKMLQPASPDSTPQRNEPWLRSDLLFLKDSLAHGMSWPEGAGFLGRTEEEVRQKAEELD